MDDFPLYSVLQTEIGKINSSKDLTVSQKTDLMKKIEELDNDGWESLAVIIYLFAKKSENSTPQEKSSAFPYSGKVVQKTFDFDNPLSDIEIDFLSIPIKLRHMVYKFVQMHIAKMETEKQRWE